MQYLQDAVRAAALTRAEISLSSDLSSARSMRMAWFSYRMLSPPGPPAALVMAREAAGKGCPMSCASVSDPALLCRLEPAAAAAAVRRSGGPGGSCPVCSPSPTSLAQFCKPPLAAKTSAANGACSVSAGAAATVSTHGMVGAADGALPRQRVLRPICSVGAAKLALDPLEGLLPGCGAAAAIAAGRGAPRTSLGVRRSVGSSNRGLDCSSAGCWLASRLTSCMRTAGCKGAAASAQGHHGGAIKHRIVERNQHLCLEAEREAGSGSLCGCASAANAEDWRRGCALLSVLFHVHL